MGFPFFGKAEVAPPPPPPELFESLLLDYQVVGLLGLLLLLVLIATKVGGIHSLLLPDSAGEGLASIPHVLLRKAKIVAYGACYLILSRDKVTKSDLKRARVGIDEPFDIQRTVRIIFIRHGESVWNYAFNRGFKPSFLVRLVECCLQELFLLFADDSAFLDSPLSEHGLKQCEGLQTFLRAKCSDKDTEEDFAALTNGEGYSLVLSSQLRRAAATAAIALSDRLQRSREAIVLHSSCQEISRNFDTMALAPQSKVPRLGAALQLRAPSASFDGSANAGNKSLGFRGVNRLMSFAQWAGQRPESCLIVGGHSLWFRNFFALYLPTEAANSHPAAKHKIVNCGVVAFTLQVGRTRGGELRHRIDPASIKVVYGGYEVKKSKK